MLRCIVIGIKAGKQTCIACGISESEAMSLASSQSDFDNVEVYINPVPYSVFNCKPKKRGRPAKAS